MKGAIPFLAVLAVVSGFSPGVKVRFDIGLDIGGSFFYSIPKTVDEARTEGWRLYRRPSGPLTQLELYCPRDKTVCGLYDDTRHIAGLQVALREDEFENHFDWKTRGFSRWRTSVNGTCYTFWAIQQYFVTEETYQKPLEDRLAAWDDDKILQEESIWVSGINGELVEVPTQEDNIKETKFTEQACIPLMGQHWYYNMTKTTECTDKSLLSWFPLTNDGELKATGFMTFGKLPIKDGERNWFERPPKFAVQLIVPDGPQCLYDLTENVGTLTMHIYYVNEPWQIWCPLFG